MLETMQVPVIKFTHQKKVTTLDNIVNDQEVDIFQNRSRRLQVFKPSSRGRRLNSPRRRFSIAYQQSAEPIPYSTYIATCISLFVMACMGAIHEIFQIYVKKEQNRKGFIPLYSSRDHFYTTHMVRRVWFTLNTPICSAPGPIMKVMDRESLNQGWTISLKSSTKDFINLGSYNYLNLSDPTCSCMPGTLHNLRKYGVGNCSLRSEFGNTKIHLNLDEAVASFLRVEDAFTFGMGFATNSLNISSLIDKNCLVLSDEFNHTSIILGIQLSGAKTIVYKHNDMQDLEEKIRSGILLGNNGQPWHKIFIFVEGVFSMHGTIANLPEIIDLKKKYGGYLYLDEAHCLGALGQTGRGITEYFNVDPKDVDILMGTFAKSFGAMGGYIAGSRKLINMLRGNSQAHHYGGSMPVVIASFIYEAIKFLDNNPKGRERVQQLVRNSRYFRLRMKQIGYIVLGEDESPVVPVIIPLGTLPYTVKFMRDRDIAVVLVSYPATPMTEGRIRCCMNAMHTQQMIEHVLQCFEDLADEAGLRISKLPRRTDKIIY